MNVTAALASTALVTTLLAAWPAMAQEAAPAAAATQGVISYPPEFFASAQPTNAHEMLLRLPGFTVEVGSTVRGFEGAAGNVLIDGQRPTTKTDDLEEVLRRVPASQVARIELIRGGAPGIDMQGKTILANVVRKSGGGFRGLFALANSHIYDGRNTPGVRLELSGGKDGRNWEGSARYGEGVDDGMGEGPNVQVGPGGVVRRRSFVDSEGWVQQYTLTGAYEQPLAGGKIRVNGRAFWDKFKGQEDNFISFPTRLTEFTDQEQDTFQTELGGRYIRPFGTATTLDVVGLRQTKDQTFFETSDGASSSRFDRDRESAESILRAVVKHRRSDALSFEVGAEGAFNELESKTGLISGGVVVDVPNGNVRVEEKRGEVFAKGTWKPWSEMTLEAGLRYEGSAISAEGDATLEKTLYFAKPRFAATWAPTDSTQLRFRFERVVGQLNFDDFIAESELATGVVTAGNPDLDPEQAWVTEAAIEQRFWGDGAIVLTIRHSALTDVIDRAPVFAPGGRVFDGPSNIGDGTKDELIADLTLPLAKFGLKGGLLKGNLTWRESEVTDPTTGQKREISKLRPLEWEATFSQDLPRWNTTFGVEAYSAWRETYYRYNEIRTDKLKTFVKPFVEYRPRPDVVIRAEIQNVTERGFRHTRQVYGGPRSTSPLLYTDDRDIQFGRMYWIRVRKTFGS
jgi:outer membrane receptor protein involved in Fe transport